MASSVPSLPEVTPAAGFYLRRPIGKSELASPLNLLMKPPRLSRIFYKRLDDRESSLLSYSAPVCTE